MDKLKRARELGVLKDGWRFVDYCQEAAPNYQWLCAILWGEKGSGKSNRMLQDGYTLFHGPDEFETIGKDADGDIKRGIITNWDDMLAWDKVLHYTVFRPKDFSHVLKDALKNNQRLSWIGWDDINIHLPRSMYSTNRRVWENFARNWEGQRANLSIFECTAPRKDRVVSFILQDMNFDVLISARQQVEVSRWFWDKDFYEPEQVNKYRLDIDKEALEIGHIPKEVWNQYWERKTSLINEATAGFSEMLEDIDKPLSATQAFPCSKCGKDLGNAYNLRLHSQACQGIAITRKRQGGK